MGGTSKFILCGGDVVCQSRAFLGGAREGSCSVNLDNLSKMGIRIIEEELSEALHLQLKLVLSTAASRQDVFQVYKSSQGQVIRPPRAILVPDGGKFSRSTGPHDAGRLSSLALSRRRCS